MRKNKSEFLGAITNLFKPASEKAAEAAQMQQNIDAQKAAQNRQDLVLNNQLDRDKALTEVEVAMRMQEVEMRKKNNELLGVTIDGQKKALDVKNNYEEGMGDMAIQRAKILNEGELQRIQSEQTKFYILVGAIIFIVIIFFKNKKTE